MSKPPLIDDTIMDMSLMADAAGKYLGAVSWEIDADDLGELAEELEMDLGQLIRVHKLIFQYIEAGEKHAAEIEKPKGDVT